MDNRREFLRKGLALVGATALTNIPQVKGDEPVEGGDVYNFKMTLKVPQVLDNTASRGYRAYKSQTIKGTMYVLWNADGGYGIQFSGLTNANFKVGGANVTYKAFVNEDLIVPRFTYIGSNATEKFVKPCLCFAAVFEPSYAIGEPTEDNSFTLMLSGSGLSANKKAYNARIATSFSGNVAGVQGCGCADYGHKSPTREASACGPSDEVSDIVATYGTWRATWKNRVFC